MIDDRINSIKMKIFEKYCCPDFKFNNEEQVIKFEFRGDGVGHKEAFDNRASKKAIAKYIQWCNDQKKIAITYLNKIEEIEKESKMFFKRAIYIVV